MMSDACREWRGALAAEALGEIDAAEEIALQAHLDGCATCRGELEELAVVARALPLADPSRLREHPEPPPVQLAAQVVDRVAFERARARKRAHARLRMLAVAAVVVVSVGIGAVVVTQRDHSTPATTVSFAPTSEASGGSAQLRARASGTEVDLVADGLDAGDWYWLWLTGDDGNRVPAGTFRGTGDQVEVTLSSALQLDAARRIWVTNDNDKVVLDARI
jgi:anti-sigma factor RsiW